MPGANEALGAHESFTRGKKEKKKKNFQIEENGSMHTPYIRVYVHTAVKCAFGILCGG